MNALGNASNYVGAVDWKVKTLRKLMTCGLSLPSIDMKARKTNWVTVYRTFAWSAEMPGPGGGVCGQAGDDGLVWRWCFVYFTPFFRHFAAPPGLGFGGPTPIRRSCQTAFGKRRTCLVGYLMDGVMKIVKKFIWGLYCVANAIELG